MSFRMVITTAALIVFFASGSFAQGMENAFGFLFWYHLIVLVPIFLIWFFLQAFGVSLAFSPMLAGFATGWLLALGGWLLLAYFGINAVLCFYISNHIENAGNILALPPLTTGAIAIYILIAIFAPKLKKSFTKYQKKGSESGEVIIDGSYTETNDKKSIGA